VREVSNGQRHLPGRSRRCCHVRPERIGPSLGQEESGSWRRSDQLPWQVHRPVEAMRASLIDWGAILAGALTAAALSFVFLTFGAAIGLSVVSPWPSSGVSARTFRLWPCFGTLVQQIGAFRQAATSPAACARAGRSGMRTRSSSATACTVRWFGRSAFASALPRCCWPRPAPQPARQPISLQGHVDCALNTDPLAYYTDTLLRPGPARPAAGGGVAQTPARVSRLRQKPAPRSPARCCPFHRQRLLVRPRQELPDDDRRPAQRRRRPRRRSASPTPTPRPIASSGKPPTRHVAPRCWRPHHRHQPDDFACRGMVGRAARWPSPRQFRAGDAGLFGSSLRRPW
jgi:hypothetical protein